jgi:type III pantothenate kinase
MPNADVAAIVGAMRELGEAPVLMASVNDRVADAIEEGTKGLRDGGTKVARFGRDLEIPIQNALRDGSTVGQDRLLNALGAYAKAQQACVVVDAGTAITVDFVDGEGVFQGGAIAPGLNLMLTVLHEHTAALPRVVFEPVGADEPFGRETRGAMRLGVQAAARGMVRHLVERYATAYGAYPQVVATGGDARVLFEGDDLVEQVVPDLTLLGIEAAVRRMAEED